MQRRTSWIVAALTALAPAASAAAGAPASVAVRVQNQVPDKRPEVAELCDQLADQVKGRGDKDAAAIETIDELTVEFRSSGPKDRKAIVKAVSKCFDARRSAEEVEQDGERVLVPNNELYLASAVALGEMGPESVKALQGWIGHKRHRKDLDLQRRLTLSLGKTADPKATGTLIDLLNHKDAALVAAAAEALAYYEDAPGDLRKDLFEALLKSLMSAKGLKDSDLNDVIARERYDTFSAALITSLGRLSGLDERDPDTLQRWWNKNKRGDWDAERP